MKELNFEREKTYDFYYGRECILTYTLDYYDPVSKASALLAINRHLEREGCKPIPFTRWNILKTHIKRIA